MLSIKDFDIYSDPFNFTIDKKDKYKTKTGGFFLISCISVLMMISLYLGKNFYFRLEPIILEKKIKLGANDKIHFISKENFTIAIKLDGPMGGDLDIKGKIFFNATHDVWKKEKEGTIIIKTKKLSFEKCNKSDYIFLEKLTDIEKWDCLDLKEEIISLGGRFHENLEEHSLSITVSNCPNETYYENSCSSLKKLNLESPPYINFLHPIVEFNYGEKDPFINMFRNIFTPLENSISKTYNCEYNIGDFSDDLGSIVPNEENSPFISMDNCFFDLNSTEDKKDETHAVNYITQSIYLSKTKIAKKRSYIKIQDLIPILNTCFTVLNFIFKNIYLFFFKFERKKLLLEKICLESEKSEVEIKKLNYNLKENNNSKNEDSNKSNRKLNTDLNYPIKKDASQIFTKSDPEKKRIIHKQIEKFEIDEKENMKEFKEIDNFDSSKIIRLYNNSLYPKNNNNEKIIIELNNKKKKNIEEKLAPKNENIFSNSFALLINQTHLKEISSHSIKNDLILNYGFCKYTLKRLFNKNKTCKNENIYEIMRLYEEKIEEPFDAFNYFKLYYRISNYLSD